MFEITCVPLGFIVTRLLFIFQKNITAKAFYCDS